MTCPQGHEIPDSPSAYCATCAVCDLCSERLTVTEYQWSLRNGRMVHPRCAAGELPRDGSITIDQKLFDILNAARLLIEPLEDCSEETNRYDAECRLNSSRHIHQMPLEKQFLFLARMESIAAAMSLAISKNYQKIKIDLDKREEKKFKEALKQAAQENRPKAEKKQLSQRDKALKALMSMGLSESDAALSVDEHLRKQGKVIQ